MFRPSRDRRRFPRYRIKQESAVLVYPSRILSDNLIDVSMGGIAFSYNDSQHLNPYQFVLLNMVENVRCLEDMPAMVASDIDIKDDHRFERRCGVKFTDLSEEQRERLATLIEELESKKKKPELT